MLKDLSSLEVALVMLCTWLWIIGGWSLLRAVKDTFKTKKWGALAIVFVWAAWPIIGTYYCFKLKEQRD